MLIKPKASQNAGFNFELRLINPSTFKQVCLCGLVDMPALAGFLISYRGDIPTR